MVVPFLDKGNIKTLCAAFHEKADFVFSCMSITTVEKNILYKLVDNATFEDHFLS